MYIRVRRCTTRNLFIDYFPTAVVVVEFLDVERILLAIWHDHDWYRKIEIEHHRMPVDNREYDDVNANDQRSNDIHESWKKDKFREKKICSLTFCKYRFNSSRELKRFGRFGGAKWSKKNFNFKSQLECNIRGTSVKLEAAIWKRTIININLEIIVIIVLYYLQ